MSTTEYSIGGAPRDDERAADGVVEQAREQAQSAAAQARARTREQVDRRSAELGTRASGVAADLRSVAEHLRSQGKSGPAGLVEQAADRVAGAGDYLQRTDGERLLHDVESLGRRRPWTAIAGGLAAGVAASRLLKASSADRYRSGTYRPPSASPARRVETYVPSTDTLGSRYGAPADQDAWATSARAE
jgi:hypothetical protein